MARIAGVDLPGNKKVVISLTYIYGIGITQSRNILNKVNIDINTIKNVMKVLHFILSTIFFSKFLNVWIKSFIS